MPRQICPELADCSEFRQTLAARPPRIVHGTAALLIFLVVVAVAWSAVVNANHVIRASGRVRSMQLTTRIFVASSADLSGRVVSGSIKEGDMVRRGSVLIQLDTARVENEIAKRQRTLNALEEELANLQVVHSSLEQQLAAARDKAQAELEAADSALALAKDRAASEIRLAKSDIKSSAETSRRNRELYKSNSASKQELEAAEDRLVQAEEKLIKAELPIDVSPIAVARRGLTLVEADFAVRRCELDARITVRKGEAEAARKELANLMIQRQAAELTSPIDGVVISGKVQPGDVLELGKPVLEIAPCDDYCFEAIVRSEDVANLSVGLQANVKLDAYDYQQYGMLSGTVVYISPDSTRSAQTENNSSTKSQGSQATTGFVVRMSIDKHEFTKAERRCQVNLGLGGTAEIVTGNESLLSLLFHRISTSVSLSRA